MSPSKQKAGGKRNGAEPPTICTYACPFSDFPPADAAGLCRTMAAVRCNKLRRLVEKNLPCHWRRRRRR